MSLVRKNILILFVIQGTNYLFPLLTIPYLARVFGPSGIGALALAQAVILYLVLIIDFGFNLTTTRRISIAYENGDTKEVNKLFTQTIFIKIIIFFLVSIFVFLICQFLTQLNEIKLLIYIGFISLIGAVLNPIWLFQGMQKINILLIPTAISKIITLILIFLFVKDKNDLNFAMLFNSLGLFLSGLISLYYVKKLKLAEVCKICFSDSKTIVKESFYVFLSYLGSSVYTTMNTFLMSFYIGLKDIGIYSSADKVVTTTISLMSPLQQAIFPNLSNFKEKKDYLLKLRNFGLILILFSALLSISLFALSEKIVLIIFGEEFLKSVVILEILSILPLIVSFGIIFGQWGLIVIGEFKLLGKIYIYGGLTHLTYIFIFLHFFGIYGAAIAIVMTEFLISLALFFAFINKVKNGIIFPKMDDL